MTRVCNGQLTVVGVEVRAFGIIYDDCARYLVGGADASDVYSLATRAIRRRLHDEGLHPAEGTVTLRRPDAGSTFDGHPVWAVEGRVLVADPPPRPVRVAIDWQEL